MFLKWRQLAIAIWYGSPQKDKFDQRFCSTNKQTFLLILDLDPKAATGLPEPQDSHASIMVRFAYDSLLKMKEITKKLESSLGPDTTELSLRIGLHSGPVTGGVLRGDRARFQVGLSM